MEVTVKNILDKFLDRPIEITINGHVIHQGELVFAKYKDIYLTLVIRKRIGTKGVPIHIPLPFDILDDENSITFDYNQRAFVSERQFLKYLKKNIKQDHLRKYNFFGNVLIIRQV